MSRETLRDFSGRIIGYIDTDTSTGNQTGRDFYQKIVGYYDAKEKVTRDFYQRIVGRGNMLSALVYKAEEAYQAQNRKNKS